MKKINFIWIIALFLLNLPLINAGPVNATDSRYDLTNLTTQDDLYGFVVEVNKLTDSIFMSGILLVSFVILFIVFRDKGTDDALLAAGFITTIITVLFTALNLVPRRIALIIIIPYALYFVYRMVRQQ